MFAARRGLFGGECGPRRRIAAQRAAGVSRQPDSTECRSERLVDQHPAGETVAEAEQCLQHLGRLHRAQHAGERTENAGLVAARHQIVGRRFGEQAAIAGGWLCIVAPEGEQLALEAQHRRSDQRLVQPVAGIVQQIARCEIVRTGGDQVVLRDQRRGVRFGQPRVVRLDPDIGVERGDRRGGAGDLAVADPVGRMDDLALQIGQIDHIVVDDAERADAVPAVFTKIHVKFIVSGRGLNEKKVERAVKLSAEQYCSASLMLEKGGVAITHSFEIVEVE